MFGRNVETTVDILAPAEVVWAVLADTAAWPDWNPTLVKCEGRLEAGQRLAVTAHMPGRSAWTFKPTVLTGEGGLGAGTCCQHMLPAQQQRPTAFCTCRIPAGAWPPRPQSASPGTLCQNLRPCCRLCSCRHNQPPAHPLAAAEPSAELVWRGSLPIPGLFAGRHYFRLEPAGGGACRLVHGEDFSGLLLPVMGGMLADTERGFHAMNAALKARAEARAGAAPE